MSPDAIIAAAVRNRANREGQVARLAPRQAIARERAHELARKLEGLRDGQQAHKVVASLSHVPDFFPTPRALVERMIAEAGLESGMSVLEPEAGNAAIADAVRALGCSVLCIEHNMTLAGLLLGKGYDVRNADFMDLPPEPRFDRVLMNPPFSNGQDAKHVMHAWQWLRKGGRLVAITCEGPFFRQDKASQAFRAFVEEHGTSERLPADSFSGPQCVRQTGVQTRIVTLCQ